MQVLLTPLFFCQRFCRTCVRLYYKDHPSEWVWQYELEPMPPLGYFQSRHAFIPDYALLLMFEEFIVTEEAFDRMTRAPRPWLGEWPRVLRLLKDEGALSTIDLKQEMAKASTARAVMLRHDMKTPSKWAHAMAHHDALLASADKAFGKAPQKAVAPSWKFQARHLPGVEGSDGQTHVLSSALLVSPGNNPNDPHFQLHEVAVASLKNQLREVNAGIAVASVLNAVPMFWAPYARYLHAKSADAPGASNAMADANAARRLFSVAFPRYAPDTVQRLGRLRSDKRVRRLRDAIRQAAESNALMEPDFAQRILEEVFILEKRIGKVRRIAGWLSSLIGMVPLPGVAPAASALSEVASSVVERSMKNRLAWFYLISDGTGHT